MIAAHHTLTIYYTYLNIERGHSPVPIKYLDFSWYSVLELRVMNPIAILIQIPTLSFSYFLSVSMMAIFLSASGYAAFYTE